MLYLLTEINASVHNSDSISVLIRVYIGVINITKRKVGRDGFISAYLTQSPSVMK